MTQDYGVAAMALGKGARAIHQSGRVYSGGNISGLLESRHIAKVQRRKSKNHLKGPHKRTTEDDKRFEESLRRLLAEQGYSAGFCYLFLPLTNTGCLGILRK